MPTGPQRYNAAQPFKRPVPATRAASMLMAITLVAFVLYSLRAAHGPNQRGEAARESVLLMLPSPSTNAPDLPTLVQGQPPARAQKPVAKRASQVLDASGVQRVAPATPVVPQAITQPTDTPAVAAHAASAPLNLSPGVMRAAASQSMGAVRGMAQASGQSLDTRRPSQGEVLASSIAETAVPDCLRVDPNKPKASDQGAVVVGGLLALPGLIYAAATGKCKP